MANKICISYSSLISHQSSLNLERCTRIQVRRISGRQAPAVSGRRGRRAARRARGARARTQTCTGTCRRAPAAARTPRCCPPCPRRESASTAAAGGCPARATPHTSSVSMSDKYWIGAHSKSPMALQCTYLEVLLSPDLLREFY